MAALDYSPKVRAIAEQMDRISSQGSKYWRMLRYVEERWDVISMKVLRGRRLGTQLGRMFRRAEIFNRISEKMIRIFHKGSS